MQESFLLEDLMELMIGLETAGGQHYRTMAGLTDDMKLKALFELLAKQEDGHRVLYRKIKADALPFASVVEDPEYSEYLTLLLKNAFSFMGESEVPFSYEAGYQKAINLEKETLLILSEMERIVLPVFHETLKIVTAEERRHLKYLYEYQA